MSIVAQSEGRQPVRTLLALGRDGETGCGGSPRGAGSSEVEPDLTTLGYQFDAMLKHR